jgi:hypothetical protein
MNNPNISVRNNQAFSQEYLERTNSVLNTLFEWANRKYSKLDILNYVIKNVACYGKNSHPSQTTIGKHAGVQRGWANIVTNELVAMGLIIKTRVIIDGDETACEYSLTPLLKDISWKLKDIVPALKLFYLLHGKKTDNTPYIKDIYLKNFKIIVTRNKSTSRKQKSKISKMNELDIQKQQQDNQYKNYLYLTKHQILENKRKKEEEDKLNEASQDKNFVNLLQGLLHGLI